MLFIVTKWWFPDSNSLVARTPDGAGVNHQQSHLVELLRPPMI